MMDRAELAKIAELLWEKKQIVLYGPPGTGKTWLAEKLARHLTDEGRARLVQFHPSYTYEDFFEGFRPEAGGSGTLTFTLRPGPFRRLAEAAEDNKTTPYILIIDEINRANLAKSSASCTTCWSTAITRSASSTRRSGSSPCRRTCSSSAR